MAVNLGFKEKYKPQYFQMLSIVKKQQINQGTFIFKFHIFIFFLNSRYHSNYYTYLNDQAMVSDLKSNIRNVFENILLKHQFLATEV